MKVLFTFLAFLVTTTSVNAQDIITKINGETIQAKVQDITQTEIKYKKFTNQNGPTYSLNKSEVSHIKYPNGDIDKFNTIGNTSTISPIIEEKKRQNEKQVNTDTKSNNSSVNNSGISKNSEISKITVSESNSKGESTIHKNDDVPFGLYLSKANSFYFGYGTTLGGIGAKVELKGLTLSIGYFPAFDGYINGGIGYQIYLKNNLYVEGWFGAFGAYSYSKTYSEGRLYGPSILVGYNLHFSEHYGINADVGLSMDVDDFDFFPAYTATFFYTF